MKRIFIVTVVFLICLMVWSPSIWSNQYQELPFSSSRTNIGIKFGFNKPVKDHYEGSICLGLNLSFYLSRQLSLEFSGQRFTSEVMVEEDDLNSGTLTAYPLQLSLRFQFTTDKRFVPYILAGVGYVIYSHDLALSEWEELRFSGENDVKGSLAFHGAAGLEFFITPSMAICLEGRYTNCKTEAEWTFRDLNNTALNASGTIEDLQIDFIMATLGLKIYF
jgi:opacity protein-like surface antigen